MIFKAYQWENTIAVKNNYLWTLILDEMIPLEQVWPRVELTLTVDKNWILSAQAVDIVDTNNHINATIERKANYIIHNFTDIEEIRDIIIRNNQDIRQLIKYLKNQ